MSLKATLTFTTGIDHTKGLHEENYSKGIKPSKGASVCRAHVKVPGNSIYQSLGNLTSLFLCPIQISRYVLHYLTPAR